MTKEKDWSPLAKDFDERQDYVAGEATNQIIDKKIRTLSDLGDMLEFGCGNGKYTRFLAESANSIIATDLCQKMVDVACEKLSDFENISFECADCYATEYESNKFDTVFMGNLIHVVLEPEKVLTEAKRLIKEKGRLILLSFTGDGMTPENIQSLIVRYIEKFGPFPEVKKPMGLADLNNLVTAAGFIIESSDLLGDDTKAMFVVARRK